MQPCTGGDLRLVFEGQQVGADVPPDPFRDTFAIHVVHASCRLCFVGKISMHGINLHPFFVDERGVARVVWFQGKDGDGGIGHDQDR